VITTALLKLTTAKAALVVTATATAGGVAVAAGTGALPDPTVVTGIRPAAHASAKPATDKENAARKADKDAAKDASKAGKRDERPENGPAGANGSPSPSLVGLCRAVKSGNKAEHGKAMQSPAFRYLITTAGGPDKVDAFCVALLASDKHREGGPANGKPDNGNGKPSGKPDTERPGNGTENPGNGNEKPVVGKNG
jgi:hypothetical protein